MATKIEEAAQPRVPLTRDRILRAAVAMADEGGLGALSMRKLAQELDVVPMALYRHVSNKEELLDGIVDIVVEEIDPPEPGLGWKDAIRRRVLSAREMLLRHPWAVRVIESRADPTPGLIGYFDEMIGLFRAGGFSMDLTHHAMHAMGSRLLGFSQELFEDTPAPDAEVESEMYRAIAERYPNIGELIETVMHDDATVVGGRGCDDRFEFEFALDLMLDGLERLRERI